MKVRSKWLLKREGGKRNGGRREGRRETEGRWRYGGNRWLAQGEGGMEGELGLEERMEGRSRENLEQRKMKS